VIPPRQVFTNKTGTGTSEVFTGEWCVNVSAVLSLSYGATPTITVNLEGSMDGTNWVSLTNATWTSGTPQKLEKPATGYYLFYRLNITANTNVTVTSALIGAGGA
jgi:hypothetical protein